ncbi:MAG: hypothetical protein ACO1QS_20700 [Verrucomicrobiota bacterium]
MNALINIHHGFAWRFFFASTLLLLASPIKSQAQTPAGYELSGEIQLEQYDLEGSVKNIRKGLFTVTVNETNWFIHSQIINDPTWDYIETGKDDENIYSLLSLESIRNKKIEKGEKVGVNSSVGYVHKGDVPTFVNSMHNAIIWLGLASGTYLKNKPLTTSNTIAPVFFPESHYLAQVPFEMQAQWTLSSNTPAFPDRVVYFSDGFFRKWNDPESALYEPPRLLKRSKPFDKGYTNAIYQTVNWTNINNIGTFPLEGVFQLYFPKIDGSSASDIRLIEKTTLIVKQIKPTAARTAWKPNNRGPGHITDFRFVTASNAAISFNYLQTNQWLSDREAITSQAFLSKVEYHKQRMPHFLKIKDRIPPPKTTQKINPLFLVGIILATTIPLILAYFITNKTKQT